MDGQKDFTSRKKEHQATIDDQNHCCLCGTKLTFKHTVDFMNLQVREEADCTVCQVRLKTKDFSLQ